MSRPGATGRSQRLAAVRRAGPFRQEEHTFFLRHSARRASFHYGKTIQFSPESERTGRPDGSRPLRLPGAPGEHEAGVR